jgi:hypothetical protein
MSPSRSKRRSAVDLFTNYRSRYGYVTRHAIVAEIWWRLEHSRFLWLSDFAYPRRKRAERRGSDD